MASSGLDLSSKRSREMKLIALLNWFKDSGVGEGREDKPSITGKYGLPESFKGSLSRCQSVANTGVGFLGS